MQYQQQASSFLPHEMAQFNQAVSHDLAGKNHPFYAAVSGVACIF